MDEIAGCRSGSLVSEESESLRTAADKCIGNESAESSESSAACTSDCNMVRDMCDGGTCVLTSATIRETRGRGESERGMKKSKELDNVVALRRWAKDRRREGWRVTGAMVSSSASVSGPGFGSTSPSSNKDI